MTNYVLNTTNFAEKANLTTNHNHSTKMAVQKSQESKKNRIERIVDDLRSKIEKLSPDDFVEHRVNTLKKVAATIHRYRNNKKVSELMNRLDRFIVRKRAEFWPDIQVKPEEYLLSANQNNLTRFLNYGFEKEVFIHYPDFSDFLIKTHIGSAMATWGDQIEFVHGKPAIRFDGRLVDWEIVRDSITLKYHAESRSTRIYDKQTNEPMEYLGANQGLVECDRYGTERLPVIAKINEEELQYIQRCGRDYRRPNESESVSEEVLDSRNYILQVVTDKHKCGSSKFSKMFEGPRHPFFRLITPSGEVKCVGFMKFNNNHNLLSHGHGRLDSPDFGDLTGSGMQYVTNMAIDESEANKFENLCNQIQSNPNLTFNFRTQNCSSFVKYVLNTLKLANLPEDETIWQTLLNLLPRIGKGNKPIKAKFINKAGKSAKITQKNKFFQIINLIIRIVTNIFVKPISLMLGDRPFIKFGDKPNPSESKVKRFFKWFVEPIRIDLPFQVQAWQESIPGTEKLEKNKRLMISSMSCTENLQKSNQSPKIHHVPGFGIPVIKNEKISLV